PSNIGAKRRPNVPSRRRRRRAATGSVLPAGQENRYRPPQFGVHPGNRGSKSSRPLRMRCGPSPPREHCLFQIEISDRTNAMFLKPFGLKVILVGTIGLALLLIASLWDLYGNVVEQRHRHEVLADGKE